MPPPRPSTGAVVVSTCPRPRTAQDRRASISKGGAQPDAEPGRDEGQLHDRGRGIRRGTVEAGQHHGAAQRRARDQEPDRPRDVQPRRPLRGPDRGRCAANRSANTLDLTGPLRPLPTAVRAPRRAAVHAWTALGRTGQHVPPQEVLAGGQPTYRPGARGAVRVTCADAPRRTSRRVRHAPPADRSLTPRFVGPRERRTADDRADRRQGPAATRRLGPEPPPPSLVIRTPKRLILQRADTGNGTFRRAQVLTPCVDSETPPLVAGGWAAAAAPDFTRRGASA